MNALEYTLDIFINTIKILNRDIVGSEVCIKCGDMEPVSFGKLKTKSSGRATIEFKKGLHLLLRRNKRSIPTKLPLFIFIQTDFDIYANGVNIAELIQESINKNDYSSIAREQFKLKNPTQKESAILSFKLRVNVKTKPKPVAKKSDYEKQVNMRSADVFHTNNQYREICRDLQAQVAFLQSKVGKLTNYADIGSPTKPKKSQTKKSIEVEPTYSASSTGMGAPGAQELRRLRRTRPEADLDFDDEPRRKEKRPNLFDSDSSGSDNDMDVDSNRSSSPGEEFGMDSSSSESGSSIGVSSSSNAPKRKQKKRRDESSDIDSDSIPDPTLSSSSSGLPDSDTSIESGSDSGLSGSDAVASIASSTKSSKVSGRGSKAKEEDWSSSGSDSPVQDSKFSSSSSSTSLFDESMEKVDVKANKKSDTTTSSSDAFSNDDNDF